MVDEGRWKPNLKSAMTETAVLPSAHKKLSPLLNSVPR